MEWGQQMKKHQQNAKDAMYHNSNYSFERRNRKTVIINTTKFTGSASNVWSTKLIEPLIIDKLSDHYNTYYNQFHAEKDGECWLGADAVEKIKSIIEEFSWKSF